MFEKVSSTATSEGERKERKKNERQQHQHQQPNSTWIRFGAVECWSLSSRPTKHCKMNSEDWVKDNGIKLKSKLSFILYFWLKHEFCQLLPSGASFWFAWDWISHTHTHTGNNSTASKTFTIHIELKSQIEMAMAMEMGMVMPTEQEGKGVSLLLTHPANIKMRVARYLIYTWWRSSFVWYNH